MAGLSNEREGARTYLTIFNGKFTKQVSKDYQPMEGEPPVMHRFNKKGKGVYEQYYLDLKDVYIRNITHRESADYGDSWLITLQVVDEIFELQIPQSGSIANALFLRLPNINFEMPVTFQLFTFNEDGKEKHRMTVNQGGTKVPYYWTKENQGDLPPLEEVIISNKPRLDDTKRLIYFKAMLEEVYKPLFEDMKGRQPVAQEKPAYAQPAAKTEAAKPVAQPDPLQQEYEDIKEAGFAGTLEDYKAYKAKRTGAKPAAATVATPSSQAAKPSFPKPQTGVPQAEMNFAGVKGATIPEDQMNAHYLQMKNLGYKGTQDEFMRDCDAMGIMPADAAVNPDGEIIPSDLPF